MFFLFFYYLQKCPSVAIQTEPDLEAQLERRSLSDEVVRLHEELLDSRKEIDDLVSSQTRSGITWIQK